jgi:alpha-L-fucosidase
MKGETWEATKLVDMIRELQPEIIFNNRLGSNGGMLVAEPEYYAGDFTSPEQIVPPQGMVNENGQGVPWEACITMNSSWCFTTSSMFSHKSTKTLIRGLIECVSKNGNMLLNIGPNAKGNLPEESVKTLLEIGEWMEKNGESIYGCGISDQPKPDWGRFTQKGNKLYAHILDKGIGPIPLIGLEGQIESAKLLSDGILFNLERPWNVSKFPNDAFLPLPWFDQLPDDNATVFELTLK